MPELNRDKVVKDFISRILSDAEFSKQVKKNTEGELKKLGLEPTKEMILLTRSLLKKRASIIKANKSIKDFSKATETEDIFLY